MKDRRLPYLDGLRGIAAASVAFKHYLLLFGVPAWLAAIQPFLPRNFYFEGSPEVSLFIVHSGFVLTLGYFSGRKNKKKIRIRESYTARLARIFPAFLAVFLLSLLAKDWAYDHFASSEHLQILSRFWPKTLDLSTILSQMTLLPLSQRGTPLIPPDWTLVIELKYSLLLPFLLLIARHSRKWLVLVTAVYVTAVGGNDNLFFGFATGMMMATFYQALKDRLGSIGILAKISLLLSAIGLYYLSGLDLPLYFPILVDSLAGALVLCLAMSSRHAKSALELRPLRNLGRVSYSLYLSHFLILLGLAPYWRDWTSGLLGQEAWDILLYGACCLAISNLLFHFVENPGIKLGKALRRNFEEAEEVRAPENLHDESPYRAA